MEQIDATTIVRVEADASTPKLVQAVAGTVTYGTTTSLGTSLANGAQLPIATANYFSGGKIVVSALSAPQSSYSRTIGENGLLAPNLPFITSTATILAASTSYFARFQPSEAITVDRIAFVTTNAATNNDNVDVGLYDSTATRIVSSGATAAKLNASAGVQTVTFTATTLIPGTVYYAALACGTVGGTAATVIMSSVAGANFVNIFGTAIGTLPTASVAGATLAAGPLVISAAAGVPVLAVRTS